MSTTAQGSQWLAQQVRWTLGHALPRIAIAGAARRDELHSQFVAQSSTPDPTGAGDRRLHHLMDRIRDQGPVPQGRYGYVTASHAVVRQVLSSNDFRTRIIRDRTSPLARLAAWSAANAPMGPLRPPSLLVTEPPEHTRYRKLVTRVFSAQAVQQLRTRTEKIADGLLGDLQRGEPGAAPVDLVASYCSLLPVTVIAEILGVPNSERQRLRAFGTSLAPSLDYGLPRRRFRAVERSLIGFDRWLAHHIERVRREPGDNLLSQLVAARDDDGSGLTDIELRSTAGLVLGAGFETTVNLLGNGIGLLHRHPDQRAALGDDPTLWPNAVDEMLRFDPPLFRTGRTAARDTTVAGRAIPQGTTVALLLAGANRDASVFAEPHRFDITRTNAKDHLSFSTGRHYCLGAALARMEGEVGLRTLYERFPRLDLTAGARRRGTRILRGYERLPARLKPTSA
ncbi:MULTISPECIES: cytochrome P450 [Streptomyces]|nr:MULTISPECIES: cytochrome P450 [Streptomyces]QIB47725.1 cytochrome P450 [Streptomyces aureoverticillatus]